MNFGEKLRKLRKDRGLSQIELCAALDIAQSALSNLENRASPPKDYVLEELCTYFGVGVGYFSEEVSTEAKRDSVLAYLAALPERKFGPVQADYTPMDVHPRTTADNHRYWQPPYDADEYLET